MTKNCQQSANWHWLTQDFTCLTTLNESDRICFQLHSN